MREKRGTPLKKHYSTVIGLSNINVVADTGTDMLLIITSAGDELLKNVNIDDLE